MTTSPTFEPVLRVAAPVRAATPPRLVPGWYAVCASRNLPPGRIRRLDLGEEALVVFRGRDTGVIHALPAHCAHQGVDLAHATVHGDCLRCPLHHWEYTDRCVRIPGGRPAPRHAGARYSVRERFGVVFVYTGAEPPHDVPGFSVDDGALYVLAGQPVSIDCPWYVPVANAFDMGHLRTVHHRQLRREPELDYPDPFTFTCNYATGVTGNGWSDRTMRLLSGDDIRVDVTCSAGTIIRVESRVRHRRGYLLVSLRPTRTGVSILPVFGVPRTKLHTHLVQGRVSAALFTAFLRRDVQALSGIRFPPGFLDNDDPTINACYRFLCSLPEYESKEMS